MPLVALGRLQSEMAIKRQYVEQIIAWRQAAQQLFMGVGREWYSWLATPPIEKGIGIAHLQRIQIRASRQHWPGFTGQCLPGWAQRLAQTSILQGLLGFSQRVAEQRGGQAVNSLPRGEPLVVDERCRGSCG